MTKDLSALKHRLLKDRLDDYATSRPETYGDMLDAWAPAEPAAPPYAPSLPPAPTHTIEVTEFRSGLGWRYAKEEAETFVEMAGGTILEVTPKPRRRNETYYWVTCRWRRPVSAAMQAQPKDVSPAVRPPLTRQAKAAGAIAFGTLLVAGMAVGWGPVGTLVVALVGLAVVLGVAK